MPLGLGLLYLNRPALIPAQAEPLISIRSNSDLPSMHNTFMMQWWNSQCIWQVCVVCCVACKFTVPSNTVIPLQEPSENGPLFCELKFYQRAARPDLSKLLIRYHIIPLPRLCVFPLYIWVCSVLCM